MQLRLCLVRSGSATSCLASVESTSPVLRQPPTSTMALASFIGKKYKLDKSEKFDEYMSALGVGMVVRKMGAAVSPVIELETKEDEYTLKSTSTFKNTAMTFKLGEEFTQERADGAKVKTVVTCEGNKLIENQLGDKPTTIVREFADGEVKATMTIKDIVCTRIYKAC